MINTQLIKQKILSENSLYLEWSFITNKDYMRISSILYTFLNQFDLQYLSETVFMILKELLMNANRAIAKRIYFQKSEFSTSESASYNEGMKSFKTDVLNQWEKQEDVLNSTKDKVILKFNSDAEMIEVSVTNTCALLKIEKERIQLRFENADQYENIIDAFKVVNDSQESAGLGIIMSILLLRNIGLSKSNLILKEDDNSTTFSILIPKKIIHPDLHQKINSKILNEIKMLPSLPDSLATIINLCNSESMEIKELIGAIEKNPSVSAEILKLANSPSFNSRNKSDSLVQAVKKVGLNAILRILYAISTMRVMNNRYKKLENHWDHSRKTSFFCSCLLKDFKLNKLAESVVIGALLHNIGKFILLSIDSEITPLLFKLIKNRSTENTKSIEEATLGISYSKLGSIIAKNWHFPDDLIASIEFHQQPRLAPELFKTHAELVYLSNMLASNTKNKINYYSLDEEILEAYNINSFEEFQSLSEKYELLYTNELQSEIRNV
jgi:HD-like signal output (HDOD) protein